MLWVNISTKVEVDIDEKFELADIKSLCFTNDKFYVLANKYKRKLGYFLLELEQNLDAVDTEPRYVIRWENKLEIDDASLSYFKGKDDFEPVENFIVSFKSIHVNSYTVLLINI